MKKHNTATALLGLLAYKPELIQLIADNLRPEMFPAGILQQCAGEMWAAAERRQAWGAQEFRDFNDDLAEKALKQPLSPSRLDAAADALKTAWEAGQLAHIYQEAARIAAKGDAIGARAHALGQVELLEEAAARPDTKTAALARSMQHMEKFFNTTPGHRVTGVDTGFLYLNTFTAGWQAGDVNIIAAPPGKGKTTVSIQSALAAAKMGNAALYFSCGDSTAEQLYMKAAAILAGIDHARIIRNTITAAEKGALARAYEELSELPFRIYDTSEFPGTVGSIRDIARRAALDWEKEGVIIVDYIQQLRPDRPGRDRVENIRQVSEDVKRIAVGLRCPVLMLSQLNRDSVKGGAERQPTNADLRGSGDLEQDASRIFFIYTPENRPVMLATKDRHGGLQGGPLQIEMEWRADIGRYEWIFDTPFDRPSPIPSNGMTPAMVGARPGEFEELPF